VAALTIFEIPGMSLEQYDGLFEEMGVRSDVDMPAGLLWHAAGDTGEGVLTTGVWADMPRLDVFYAEWLGPALVEEGIPAVVPRLLPVHNMILRGAGREPGVIVLLEVEGLGHESYDGLVAAMDAHAGDGSGHPAVSHVAARTAEGMVIVDVWDSPESFGRFAEEQIAPAAQSSGMPPLEPRFVPVHNHIVAPSATIGG
jgi:hypothetical protein